MKEIKQVIEHDLRCGIVENILKYAADHDTYIRKNTYIILGCLYRDRQDMRESILSVLDALFVNKDEKVRQTVVYALGEIGKIDAQKVLKLFEKALEDEQPSVGRAVTGALKQMGQKNPTSTLEFAKRFLHHPDPKIRRKIIHGIELHGRTHPEDILPLLTEVQNDPNRDVRKIITHVISQISYKKGCLEKVISTLKGWENKELVEKALKEILEVHKRYEKFSAKSFDKAKEYIEHQFNT